MQIIRQEMKIMRKAIGLIIVLGLVGCASLDKQPEVTVEFRLAETEPAEGLTEMTFESTGEKFYLHDEVVLTNADIVLAEADKSDFGSIVNVTLTSDGAEKLAQVTGNNISKHMGIVVDGELVSCPRINAQISGGEAQIIGNLTEEEAERIATGITQ
jgi:preprotein translocase subunit SecD